MARRNTGNSDASDGPMGRKPRKTAPPLAEFAFVECRLNEADKVAIRALEFDLPRVWEWLWLRTEEGYKFSLKYEPNMGAFLVSLTQGNKQLPDYNRCLTARNSDIELSLLSLLYKYDVLLDGGPLPENAERPKTDVWD